MLPDEIIMYGFVLFWILWMAVFKKYPGRWLTKLCEGPLMGFATYIDGKVMGVAAFVVWFSRDPPSVLNILSKEMSLKMAKPTAPIEVVEEQARSLEEARGRYGELPRLSIAASILLIIIFFLMYLLMYLVGVH